ncbi:MAG: immunoglobulin domain-containing protein [Opitutaceae bacterium]|jgi:hypothetical protein|nr:immunoglobulin domain-containing protein [Opitutaceae bacterium]
MKPSLAVCLLILCVSRLFAAAPTGAGVQVSHTPSPDIYYIKVGSTGVKMKRSGKEIYVADPAIAKLPNGDYVMTHSLFGGDTTADTSPVSKIFRSTDNGETWTLMKEVTGLRRASLFVHNNALYLIGSYSLNKDGTFNVGILKSTDNGATWTTPADANNGLLRSGETGTTKTPMIHNNRVWLSLGTDRAYSASISSDLMKESSWTRSTPAAQKTEAAIAKWPAPVALHFGGAGGTWTEAQIVASPEHGVTIMPKIQFTSPNAVPHTALFHINAADGTMTFAPEQDFVPLAGAQKKFGATYDFVSQKYYALTNTVLHADKSVIDPNSQQVKHELIRNTATLASSKDLIHWDIEKIFIHARDADHTGWQYFTFIIDGDDLAIASRTAFKTATDSYSPPRGHDSNLLTFHRLENFRTLAPAHYIKCESATVNRYETTHYQDAPLGRFARGHTFASAPDALAQSGDGTVYVRESTGGIIKSFDAHGNYLGSVDTLPAGVNFTASVTLDIIQPPSGLRNWEGEYSADWYDPRNWFYWNRPDTGAESALFGTSITSPATVKLAQSCTLAALTFRSEHAYTIAADSIKSSDGTLTYDTGVIVLKADSGTPVLAVHQGRHTIAVPVTLPAATDIILAPDTALSIDNTLSLQGALRLNIAFASSPPASAPLTLTTVTKTGIGAIEINLTGVTAATPAGTGIIAITGAHNLAATDFTVNAGVAVFHSFENGTLTISPVPPPAISAFPDYMVPGQSVTITGNNFIGVSSVLFDGVPAQEFTVASATKITVTVPDTLAAGGKITIRCADGRETVSGLSFTLAVAPAFTTQPANISRTVGENATFSVAATGAPSPTYQWQSSPNGATWMDISGATGTTLTLTAVTLPMNGMRYRCLATNDRDTVASNAATLTIDLDPTILAALQLKEQLETSGTTPVTVTGTIDLSLVGGAAVSKGKTIVGSDTTATIAGSLTLAASASNTVILGLNFTGTAFVIDGANDVNISHCTFTDTPVSIIGGSDNVAFSWNKFAATPQGGGSAMIISNAGPVIGILFDHNLWDTGLRADMPAVTNARVLMFNNYLTATGNTTATVAGAGAQILSVRNIYQGVNNPLAKQSTGLLRSLDDLMLGTAGTTAPGGDKVFVPGYSHVVDSDGSVTAIDITANAGNTAGKNSLTPAATTGTANISATVNGSGATANNTEASVPTAGGFTLTANASGFAPSARQWYLDNFVIGNATSATYTATNAIAAVHAGTYSIALTAPTGEIIFSAGYKVSVGPLAAPVITTHPASKTITIGDSATFTVTATGESLGYQWMKNGFPISGATSASYTITNAQQSDAGSYTVRVSNPAGSPTSNAAVLKVNPAGGGSSDGGGGGGGLPSPLLFTALTILSILRAVRRGRCHR